jgi:GT2 family glycosyltransferase
MSTNAASALASIIIPCWRQLEFTRQCIAALNRQDGKDTHRGATRMRN